MRLSFTQYARVFQSLSLTTNVAMFRYSQQRSLVFKKNDYVQLFNKPINGYKQRYNAHGEEIDEQTDFQTDVKETVNRFLEFYSRRDVNTANALVESYQRLQGARLGIRVSDKDYQQFLYLTEEMIQKNELSPKQVKIISMKLQQIGVFTASIWKHILEYVDKQYEQIDGVSYIEIIYTVMDSRCDTNVDSFVIANEKNIQNAIIKSHVNILAFAQGLFLLSRIRDLTHEEKEAARNIILKRTRDIYQTLDANQLADIIFLMYELFAAEISQKDISDFMKKTIDTFMIKDMAEYDQMLQRYEFMDRKNDEIGIMDNLKWSSAAKVLTVVTDDEFYDGNLLRRLEDLINRKSETDIIDLDSASLLLESLSLIEISEMSIVMRILEMVDRRFQEESKKAYEIVHPSSIVRMMTVLNHFLETDIALEFCDRLQNYFAGMVKSGDIDYKLNYENLLELKMAFEESPICHVDKDLFKHIDELIAKETIKRI